MPVYTTLCTGLPIGSRIDQSRTAGFKPDSRFRHVFARRTAEQQGREDVFTQSRCAIDSDAVPYRRPRARVRVMGRTCHICLYSRSGWAERPPGGLLGDGCARGRTGARGRGRGAGRRTFSPDRCAGRKMVGESLQRRCDAGVRRGVRAFARGAVGWRPFRACRGGRRGAPPGIGGRVLARWHRTDPPSACRGPAAARGSLSP